MFAVVPLARIAEQTRPEVPADSAPEAVDSPQNAVLVADVVDIGVAVGEKFRNSK